MKKIACIILSFGYFLISVNNSDAQDRRFGIKGGATAYNLTTEFGNFESTTDRKIGFEAGVFGDFPISEIFSIQLEAVYTQKGGEGGDEVFGTTSITLSYVDVPLLFKITAPLDGTLNPYIFGGGYAGYLIDASIDITGEGNQDVAEFVEDINYGLKLGLGVNIGRFVIDARYDIGLAHLFAEDINLSQDDYKITTSGVVVTAGISF